MALPDAEEMWLLGSYLQQTKVIDICTVGDIQRAWEGCSGAFGRLMWPGVGGHLVPYEMQDMCATTSPPHAQCLC